MLGQEEQVNVVQKPREAIGKGLPSPSCKVMRKPSYHTCIVWSGDLASKLVTANELPFTQTRRAKLTRFTLQVIVGSAHYNPVNSNSSPPAHAQSLRLASLSTPPPSGVSRTGASRSVMKLVTKRPAAEIQEKGKQRPAVALSRDWIE